MRPFLLIPACALAACALAACAPTTSNNMTAVDNNTTIVDDRPNATSAPLNPPAPGTPGGLDNDMTPVSEAPFTLESAQGAADVVQTYYALVEEGKYAEAYKLWEPGQVGTQADFERNMTANKQTEVHALIGAPGEVAAGAGQRYVEVPVQVYGRVKDGPFNMRGTATLHRTEVDGAAPEQKKWRIRSIKLQPTPTSSPTPSPSPAH